MKSKLIALSLVIAVSAMAQMTTNPPGVRSVSGASNTTNSPGSRSTAPVLTYGNVAAWTNVIYVSPLGSDATGDGSRTNPIATLARAATNQAPGTAIALSTGVFYITNAFRIPTNGAVIAAGIDRTIVKSYVTPLASAGPTFLLTHNSYLADMTIDCALRGTVTNATYPTWLHLYQAGFGGHKNVTNYFTNAIVSRVKSIGETDAFFCRTTNACTADLYSCVLTSKWDTIAFMEAGHKFNFYNCDVRAVGPNAIPSNENRANAIAVEAITNAEVRVIGGTFEARNTNSTILVTLGSGKFYFINVAGTNTSASDFTIGMGGELHVTGCLYNPAKAGDEFGDGVIVWETNKVALSIGGASVSSGNGAPTASATEGSIYFDRTSGNRYRRTAGSWLLE
jgi:hypothetical protein